ncbi:hypothetical protein GCM10010254_46730 [Streptomyces chromofuscus]|nr:hypothetical protein GCM10010254_46730 [Streptomyces chromofuscus]
MRVALVDDQALMRAGFRALLDAEDGIEVVGEAADGEQGLALVRERVPDVALIDVQMPVMTGIQATRRIGRRPRPRRRPRGHPHQLRPRRVRLPRAARERRGLPAEGHRTGRSAPGDRGRGAR